MNKFPISRSIASVMITKTFMFYVGVGIHTPF